MDIQTKTSAVPENSPSRHQIVGMKQAAALANMHPDTWRKMSRDGKVLKGFPVGARKLGWRYGDLIDWIEQRAQQAAA